MDLGNLQVYLELSTEKYDRTLAEYQKKTEKFGEDLQKSFTKASLHLKPTVDDSALTKLNRHLDLKQRHFSEVQRYFNANPLTPKTNTQDLDRLTEKLREYQRLSKNNFSVRTPSSAATPVQNVKVQIDTKGIENAIKQLNKGSIGSALSSVFTAPFKAVTASLGSIFTGALEGIGTPLGKEIGIGLKDGIENEFGDIIGSFKFLGRKVSGEFTKEFKLALGNDLNTIRGITQELLGKQNIVRESASVRFNRTTENARTNRQASLQTDKEVKFVRSNLGAIRERASNIDSQRESYNSSQAALEEKISKTSQRLGIDPLQKQLSEINSKREKIISEISSNKELSPEQSDRLNKELSTLRQSYSRISEAVKSIESTATSFFKSEADKLAQQADEIFRQEESLRKITQSVDNLEYVDPITKHRKPKSRQRRMSDFPDTYRSVISEVGTLSNKNISLEDIPRLVPSQLPKGTNAAYNPDTNSIQVPKAVYESLNKGEISNKALEDLVHELRHAVQLDFGRLAGQEQTGVNLLQATSEEAKKYGRRIEKSVGNNKGFSNDFSRAVETDAYIFAARNTSQVRENLDRQSAIRDYQNSVGVGGGILYNKLAAAQGSAMGQLGDIKSKSALNVDQELSDVLSSFEEIRQIAESELNKISNIEVLPVDEIKALQAEMLSMIDEAIQASINLTKDFAIDVASKPDRVKAQTAEILQRSSYKKDLIPMAERYGIDPSGLKKKDLISALTNSENLEGVYQDTLAISREKAQRQLARQEALSQAANVLGQGARGVSNVATGVANVASNVMTSTPVQVAGHLANGIYGGLKGAEGIALDLIPGGGMAKGVLKNTVVPAAMFGAATHFLPGGQVAAEGLNHLASGLVNPLLEAGSSGVTGAATNFISESIPNVFGLQGSLSGAVTEAVNGIAGIMGEVTASALSMIAGGKVIETTVKRLPMAIPQQREKELLALPASQSQPQLKASANSSSSQIQTLKNNSESKSQEAKKIADQIVATTAITTEEAINHAKRISGSFQKTYKDLKDALKAGDKELSTKLANIISDMADKAMSEIADITSSIGEGGNIGSDASNRLAQTKAQVSRYRNESTRVLKRSEKESNIPTIDVTKLNSSIDADEVLAEIEKNILEQISKSASQMSSEGTELYAFEDVTEAIERLKARLLGQLDPSQDPAFVGNNAAVDGEMHYQSFRNAEADINSRYNSGVDLSSISSGVGQAEESLLDRVKRILKADSFGEFNTGLSDLIGNIQGLFSAFAGFAALGFIAPILTGLATEAINAAIEFERLRNIINFANGGTIGGAEAIKFVREEVGRLNTDLQVSLNSYAKLAATSRDTSLEGEGTEQIFSAVSQASAVYGLSPEAQSRAFIALEQIMSKNVLSSEELKGQLAESLPGAVQTSARALGVTTAELQRMLEAGQIVGETFLPKFAAQLSAETSSGVAGAAMSAQGKINALNNTLFDLRTTFGAVLVPVQNFTFDILTNSLKALVAILPVLLKYLAGVGVMFAGKMLKGVLAFASAQLVARGGIMALGTAIRVAMPVLATFAKQFLLFNAAIDAVNILSKSFQNLGGDVVQFANNAEQALNKFNESLKRSKDGTVEIGAELPKSTKDLQGNSKFEGTLIETALKPMIGDQGLANLEKVSSAPLAYIFSRFGLEVGTNAEKALQDTQIAINDLAMGTNEALSQLYSNLDAKSGKGLGFLKELNDIDAQIEALQSKRRALSLSDTEGRQAIQKEIDGLLVKRQPIAENVANLKNSLDTQIQGIEGALKQLEDMRSKKSITQDAYIQQTTFLKKLLEDAKKGQEQLGQATRGTVDALRLMAEEYKRIVTGLADANTQLEIANSGAKAQITSEQANGNLSQTNSTIQQAIVDQETLAEKIKLNQQAIRDLQSQLASGEMARVLETQGLTGAGSEAIRSRSESSSVADSQDGKILEQAANYTQQLEQLQLQTNQQIGDINNSRIQAQETIRNTNRSITDYLRSIADNMAELQSSIASNNLDTAVQEAKNKIQRRLSGLGNRFFSDIGDMLSSLLDDLFAPMRNQLEFQNAARTEANRLRDQVQQGQDLSLQHSNGATGATTKFTGIQVTSAVDASGEPGLDYVVSNGERGARFGSLTSGEVIETVTDQNWENNMGYGGPNTGQRGYGNQVIVRTIDEVTGEVVDLLYAHLDEVLVQEGQRIDVGTVLGTQGRTGSTTGAHVSLDFFGKDSNSGTSASLAMRDRLARELANGANNLNARINSNPVQSNTSQRPAQTSTNPSGRTVQLAQEEAIRLATLAILEAPTAMGRLDVAQAVMNRVNSGNYGENITEVAYAPGQFEPFFGRNPSQLRTQDDAVRMLQEERGMSVEAAQNALREFFQMAANPQMMADAANHVGGRTDFKGVSQYGNRVASEDPLRQHGENFFHIGGNQTSAQLRQYASQSPTAILTPFSGGSSNGTATQTASADFTGVNNRSREQSQSYLDSLQRRMQAVNEEAAIRVSQFVTQFGRKLDTAQDQLDDDRIARQRQLEDVQDANLPDTPENRSRIELRQIDRQEEDATRTARRNLRDIEDAISDFEATREGIIEAGKIDPNILQVLPELEEKIKSFREEAESLRGSISQTAEAFAESRKRIEDELRRAEENRQFNVRTVDTGLRGELTTAQNQRLNRTGRGSEALENQFSADRESITLEYDTAVRNAKEEARLEGLTNEELENRLSLLSQIHEERLLNLNATRAENEENRNFEITTREQQGAINLGSAQADNLSAMGFETQANELRERVAVMSQELDFATQLKELQDFAETMGLTAEQTERLQANLIALNDVKLEGIQDQFSVVGQLLPGIQSSFQGLFSGLLTGTQSVEDVFKGFLESILNNLANLAAQMLTNELFGAILGIGGGSPAMAAGGGMGAMGGAAMGGGGSAWGGIAQTVISLFAGGIGGFAKGGVVESRDMNALRRSNTSIGKALRKEGARSVLATLTPGERVLTVAENRIFEANQLDRLIGGEIQGYRNGGVVGGLKPDISGMQRTSNVSVNAPVTVNGASNEDVDSEGLKAGIENVVSQYMMKQSRPGGALYRR